MSPTMSQRLWVVAHRGGCDLRPENTFSAFYHAITLGVDMVETDVRWSKDRQLVLLHDKTLERTAGAPEAVGHLTLAELRRLDGGSHFDGAYRHETIPTLEDLFRLAYHRVKVMLDLKEDEPYLEQILDLISTYRMEWEVVMGVRTVEALQTIRKRNPTLRLLSLGHSLEMAEAILEAGADLMRLWSHWVTPARVESVRRQGKPVWVMVDQSAPPAGQPLIEELRWFASLGVNGVILDDPRLALQVNQEIAAQESSSASLP